MKNKFAFAGLFLAVGLISGLLLSLNLDIFSLGQCQAVKHGPAVVAGSSGIEGAIIDVAAGAGKAVVSISTERTEKIRRERRFYFQSPFGRPPFSDEDDFSRFFDDFFGAIPDRDFKQMGLGSGVIIDPQGYILTNEHVINGADKITVKLSDGRELKAVVKGKDIRSDLAVIKVEARNLPVATLGESDDLRIGQWVVAIGNPFGFALQNAEPTVTVGVVSALHRSLGKIGAFDRDYSDLIQTDAAINPGNSGGPLVNLKGEVVGINVAIFSTSGGYQGVGFAIPVNNAKKIITQLIAGKKILYGWLGVTIQDLNEDIAKYFGLAAKEGVLVSRVLQDSPAQKGGLKTGDVIKRFADQPVKNIKELLAAVSRSEVGSKAKVTVLREKKELVLEVQVGERPDNPDETEEESEISVAGWRGLEVAELKSEQAKGFQVEEEAGVLVVNVAPGSPAEEAGLIPGDVILEINRQPVNNPADYEKTIKDLKSDALVRTSRGYFLVKGEK